MSSLPVFGAIMDKACLSFSALITVPCSQDAPHWIGSILVGVNNSGHLLM